MNHGSGIIVRIGELLRENALPSGVVLARAADAAAAPAILTGGSDIVVGFCFERRHARSFQGGGLASPGGVSGL